MSSKKLLHLKHFSHKKDLKEIDPEHAGTGVDSRTKGRGLEHKFSHYYHEDQEPEAVVKERSPHEHKVTVDTSKHPIYDFAHDPKNIIDEVKKSNYGAFNMDKASEMLKKHKYAGFTNSQNQDNPNTYYMYDKHPTEKRSSAFSNAKVREVAEGYKKGLKHPKVSYDVSPERGAKIAAEYEKMKHDPTNPKVKRAYDALIKETEDQWKHIQDTGLRVSKIEGDNPYPKGSKDVLKDINENNHLFYYPTQQGFGSGDQESDHPMLQKSKHKINGEEVPANDIFRIVHDYFGHAKEGNGFGPRGEENAWMGHKQMYSPEAQKALTTETRGQNSWVNFGPKGKQNQSDPANTTYADQKAGLLPDWVTKEEPTEEEGTPKYARGGMIFHEHGIPYRKRYDEGGGGDRSPADYTPSFEEPEDSQQNTQQTPSFEEPEDSQEQQQKQQPSATLPMYDISGKDPIEGTMPHENVHKGIESGDYTFRQGDKIPVFKPDGSLSEVPAEEAADGIRNKGYLYATPEKIKAFGGLPEDAGGLAAFGQGFGEGTAGPLSPAILRGFGVSPEQQRLTEEAHQGLHTTGELAGLTAGFFTGTGEAALLEKLGAAGMAKDFPTFAAAEDAYKVAKAAKNIDKMKEAKDVLKVIPWGQKFGAAAIKGGIENAALTTGNEVSHWVQEDPKQHLETALAHTGMSALLGGGVSGALGTVAPLVAESKVGRSIGKVLNDAGDRFRYHVNNLDPVSSVSGVLGRAYDGIKKAGTSIGELPTPELQEKATEAFQKLQKGPLAQLEESFMEAGPNKTIVPSEEAIQKYLSQAGKSTGKNKRAIMQQFADSHEEFYNSMDNIYKEAGIKNPIERPSVQALEATTGELTPGAKVADFFIDKVVPKSLGGLTGAVAAHTLGLGPAGAGVAEILGAHYLGPFFNSVVPGLTKQLLKVVPDSMSALSTIDYVTAAARGAEAIGKASKNVFNDKTGAALADHMLPTEKDRKKLSDRVDALRQDPHKILEAGGNIPHYLPDHTASFTATASNAVNYLSGLKPSQAKASPLDATPPVSSVAKARYDRALNIAERPTVIFNHIKQGTLTPSDVQDLKSLYPKQYDYYCKQLTDNMTTHIAKGKPIPYNTRIGLSMMMCEPLDSTMTPSGIQAAQQKKPQAPAPAAQGGAPKKSTNSLNKMGNMSKTPLQNRAESKNTHQD